MISLKTNWLGRCDCGRAAAHRAGFIEVTGTRCMHTHDAKDECSKERLPQDFKALDCDEMARRLKEGPGCAGFRKDVVQIVRPACESRGELERLGL